MEVKDLKYESQKQKLVKLFKVQHSIGKIKPSTLLENCSEIKDFELLLVPYDAKFIEKYHSWMQDESIYKLVGCEEAMSLEEVETAQKMSQNDAENCKLAQIQSNFSCSQNVAHCYDSTRDERKIQFRKAH